MSAQQNDSSKEQYIVNQMLQEDYEEKKFMIIIKPWIKLINIQKRNKNLRHLDQGGQFTLSQKTRIKKFRITTSTCCWYKVQNLLEEALEDFGKAIILDPFFWQPYFNRGDIYFLKQFYDKEIQDYDKAIERNPENVDAFYNRGYTYQNIQQYDKVIQDYSKAIELNPNNAMAFSNRGITYYNMHQYDSAVQDYDIAIEIDPNYDVVSNYRGLAYYGLKQYDKAIQDCNYAIKLNPNYADASWYNQQYLLAGLTNYNMQQYEQAIQDYNKAIQLNPNYVVAFNNRGIHLNSCNYMKRQSLIKTKEFLFDALFGRKFIIAHK